jgi:hypothetical protein
MFILVGFVSSGSGADFIPLSSGNSWTYQDAATRASFTVSVGAPILINGNVYYPVLGYTDGPLWVRQEDEQLVYWNDTIGADSILTRFSPSADYWPAPERHCSPLARTLENRAVHDGAGGHWADVLEIQYVSFTCADHGYESEQYAENIGMVRRVVQTIAGPRTFDLVHARIGNRLVLPGDRGSFTVTADSVPGQGAWLATFRLDLGTGPGMRLGFTSGQEFDAALRDSAGNILWVWSADKLFLQAMHERFVTGEWKETFEVPHPPSIPEGPLNFILEVWLTTAPDQPRFAAAVPIAIQRTGGR